jgi:hypothetical protein
MRNRSVRTRQRARGALCRSRETATAGDYFLAVLMDGDRIATLSVFLSIWCSQCARYNNTRHFLCHMFYDYILEEIWMV